jgi:hypothetical protein
MALKQSETHLSRSTAEKAGSGYSLFASFASFNLHSQASADSMKAALALNLLVHTVW